MKRRIFFSLALTAALFFFASFLGGEFLHSHIHHHASQQEHNDCQFYQLAGQMFVFAVAVLFASSVFSALSFRLTRAVHPFKFWHACPNPRAPPSLLS